MRKDSYGTQVLRPTFLRLSEILAEVADRRRPRRGNMGHVKEFQPLRKMISPIRTFIHRHFYIQVAQTVIRAL